MPLQKYKVIRDTREQEGYGWKWNKSRYCKGTIIEKLDQADYVIEGYEDEMAIERKGSVSEWAGSLTKARFFRELDRSKHIRHFWIILEFEFSDIINYPVGSGIPPKIWKKIRFKGPSILKKMIEIQYDYPNVHIWCVGDKGKEVATSILKRTMEQLNE